MSSTWLKRSRIALSSTSTGALGAQVWFASLRHLLRRSSASPRPRRVRMNLGGWVLWADSTSRAASNTLRSFSTSGSRSLKLLGLQRSSITGSTSYSVATRLLSADSVTATPNFSGDRSLGRTAPPHPRRPRRDRRRAATSHAFWVHVTQESTTRSSSSVLKPTAARASRSRPHFKHVTCRPLTFEIHWLAIIGEPIDGERCGREADRDRIGVRNAGLKTHGDPEIPQVSAVGHRIRRGLDELNPRIGRIAGSVSRRTCARNRRRRDPHERGSRHRSSRVSRHEPRLRHWCRSASARPDRRRAQRVWLGPRGSRLAAWSCRSGRRPVPSSSSCCWPLSWMMCTSRQHVEHAQVDTAEAPTIRPKAPESYELGQQVGVADEHDRSVLIPKPAGGGIDRERRHGDARHVTEDHRHVFVTEIIAGPRSSTRAPGYSSANSSAKHPTAGINCSSVRNADQCWCTWIVTIGCTTSASAVTCACSRARRST